MGFQVSPGVEVKEIDLTNVIPAVSTSIGGYAGYFRSGPVNEVVLVSSEKELASKFGSPDAAHTQSFLTAASFLKYGNALKVVRAGDGGPDASGSPAGTLRNAFAGIHERPNGGFDALTFVAGSIPEFLDVNGSETLSIVETGNGINNNGPEGDGAKIFPRYDVSPEAGGITGVNGFIIEEGDGVNVGGVTGGTTITDGIYSVTLQGETFNVSVTGGETAIGSATVALENTSPDSQVFVLSNAQADLTFSLVDGSNTLEGFFFTPGNLADVTIGSGATAADSPTPDVFDGQTLTVFTDNDATNADRHSFTVTVTDNSGTPTFALAAGVDTVASFDVFPSSLTGLKAFDDAGNVIPGLFFTVKYDIAGIAAPSPGENYSLSNISVRITDVQASPDTIVDIAESNFQVDQDEEEFKKGVLIENEEVFDVLYPPATDNALPGLMFARNAGAMGNSLAAYILDELTFASAPTGIQDQFDAAPEGTEVHVFIFDQDGEITGIAGSELEKYSFLDTTEGAKLDDGSNNNVKDVINAKSDYIYMGRDTAASATAYSFEDGADVANPGVATVGDINTALDELADTELVDVNLLFAQVDPTEGAGISAKLQTIAFTRKDAVAFISPPIVTTTAGTTAATDVTSAVQASGVARTIAGSYTFFDSTALYVYNKYADNYVYIPASGHMAGLCAKTDGLAEPWFSPAGFNRGGLLGVTKLAYNPKKADRDTLYKAGVNPIVSFPGEGIVLFGDKTGQAKPSAFDRINVRRLFTVLEKAIATAAKFQLFELNDEFTRAMFRNMTEPFLRDVKGRRGITDFLVVCDETNNTGDVVDTNRFVADIYIKPARSINFITLNFIATRTGVDFSEIVGK